MSIFLPNQAGTDLSAAQVGTAGNISVGIHNRPSKIGSLYPKLVFNNESGCGLAINMQGSNRQLVLPAGAWTEAVELYNNDTAINWTVLYVLPNQPVSKLYVVLYWPDEKILRAIALGNSPIGISGGVTTTAGKTLQDDTDNPNTSFIEATPTDQSTSSWARNNDASGFEQVLSAGVLRKIIKVVRGNATTTKAAIDFGDSGDLSITTYHGVFDVGCIFPGNQVGGDIAANQIGPGALDTDVTIIATQIASGNIPSAVKNQDGNQLVGSEQTGGAGAGRTIWIGTTDPGGSAAEGDIWIDA